MFDLDQWLEWGGEIPQGVREERRGYFQGQEDETLVFTEVHPIPSKKKKRTERGFRVFHERQDYTHSPLSCKTEGNW